MMHPAFKFLRHPGSWSVCRLGPDEPVPEWANAGLFSSATRTQTELSIICQEGQAPPGIQSEPGWGCLQLQGPFPFHLTGVLASFLMPLAEAGIPIFALSTYDTDWVLIPGVRMEDAVAALVAAGHELAGGTS